ncbi:MAG: RloB domain-containing protein [Kiritimatiellae bacterium]|nr:RloB domain-containing protein [Kiritimatiellia bacterium]
MVNQAKAGKISRREFMRGMSLGRSLARPYGNRPPRRYFLIVCEGEETEPNYFNSIAAQLPKDMVNRITVKGVGRNTLHLIDAAKEEIAKRRAARLPDYYYVWLVFDRDEFPADHFNRTIDSVESINKQNMSLPPKARRCEHWKCAWSNEAFELWYVLHFREQLGGAVSRTQYQKMLEEDIRACTAEKSFAYKKNDPQMFARLKKYMPEAIRRAKRALEGQLQSKGASWADMNPATRVHELVGLLMAYV